MSLIETLTQLQPLLTPLLVAILTPLVTYFVTHVIANMPANKRAMIEKVAQTGVAATEQTAGMLLNGPGKKQAAIEYVQKELGALHVSATPEQISALIEQTVLTANQIKAQVAAAQPVVVEPLPNTPLAQ